MALAARRATRVRTHLAEGAGEGRRHPRAAPVSATRRARAAEPAGRRARGAVRDAPQGADRLSRSAPLAGLEPEDPTRVYAAGFETRYTRSSGSKSFLYSWSAKRSVMPAM